MNIEEEVLGLNENGRHYLNELLTRHVASKVIKEGDVVFDLGANVGYHTADFSQRVGPNGIVHAFEPNPELWPHLYQHSNVRVWPFAAGDRLSIERFFLPLEFDQVGSLFDARDWIGDVPIKILTVAQVDIDSLAEATDTPVSFMKIDVERNELAALRGMKNTLSKYRPPIIYESHTAEIFELLDSIGYTVRNLLSPFSPTLTLPNVLAQHKDDVDLINDILPNEAEALEILEKCRAV